MSSLPGLSRAQPPDRGQPTRATGEHPGAPSCWLLAPSPRWAGFGIRLWTQSVSQLVPQDMQACHPKDKGPRNPPPTLLLSPPLFPSHLLPPTPEGEATASLRVSTAAPVCLPTRDCQPSALAQAPPILPGAAAARGACRPSRLHSGTRRWLDTDVNPAGRANSGHPQRQLRAQAGPAGKSYLGVAKYQGHC